jgi:hypothetical protein
VSLFHRLLVVVTAVAISFSSSGRLKAAPTSRGEAAQASGGDAAPTSADEAARRVDERFLFLFAGSAPDTLGRLTRRDFAYARLKIFL